MGYDYQPQADKPNPMLRSKWESMPIIDQAAFFRLGGTLIDDPEPEKEAEVMTFAPGKTCTRGEWDAMTAPQQAAFLSS